MGWLWDERAGEYVVLLETTRSKAKPVVQFDAADHAYGNCCSRN